MKDLPKFLSFLFFLIPGVPDAQPNLLIENVNYFDFKKENFINNSTLLIENGRIAKIGKNGSIEVTEGTKKIDGTNKWLIPGLIDAHIHLFQSGGLYTRPDAINLKKYRSYEDEIAWVKENAPDLLKRYLSCGITSVIDIGGPIYNLSLRKEWEASPNTPNIFITGPLASTYQPAAFQIENPPIIKVRTGEEGREVVRQQLPYKPDFIKIWYIAGRIGSAESNYEIVKATIEESHQYGLKVAVHATQLNTAKLAVKAGADFLVHSVDDKTVDDDFIQLLKDNDVVYIPTLIVGRKYAEVFGQQNELSYEDFTISNPTVLGSLFDLKHLPEKELIQTYKARGQLRLKMATENQALMAKNLKILADNGITIATGTDAGNIGTLHASSYYQELDAMAKAGLNPIQVLKASTLNGAKILDKEEELGSIEEGKRADLVLLERNPLEDIQAYKQVEVVIKDGELIDLKTLRDNSPEALAQRQLNAYNARDIEAFLEPYSEDVEIYNFPNELIHKGKEEMRLRYTSLFESVPDLHCELVNRIVLGNMVMDQERVSGFPNGRIIKAVAIYKVENGKINKVYFVRE